MTAEVAGTVWDVFVSYSRSDAQRTGVLVAGLQDQGLRVFVDDTAVDDFTSISTTITHALMHAKVLLAVYSADYPERRACQWELTYAYLAGQREGDPRKRVLVVNPEPTSDHIHPLELRDARHWPWPATPEAADRLAARVAAHTASLPSPMGSGTSDALVPWLPAPARTGSARFVDRLAEQWHIHTALNRHRAPLVAQSSAGRSAQLRGMPGIGKSLLAQEYALRFSPAFPGGIFWFDLHACIGSTVAATMEAYAQQISTVTAALGLERVGRSLPEMLSRLAIALGERGTPCLWVVDGVPDGLPKDQLHQLRGPHLLAATLITTRSLRYSAFAEVIDVAPLSEADGLRLLTAHRPPQDELDLAAALALVHDVGGHPQALDLISDLASAAGFTHARNRLHSPGADVLSPKEPTDQTPPSRHVPFVAGLLTRPLSGERPVDDVLRLLALACPAPLSQSLLENVLSTVTPYDPWESGPLVAEAIDTLLGSGALRPEPAPEAAWTVHPLLARAVRRHDSDTARQEDLRRVLLHALATSPAPAPVPAPAPAPAPAVTTPAPSTGIRPPAPAHPRPQELTCPGPVERSAAFDLQVELITRVGVQPLSPEQGSLREALTSLHTLFATTRDVLHRIAAETPVPHTLPALAAALLNQHLRPFLSTWHPALHMHEATRPHGVSPVEHERAWPLAAEMRAALAELRAPLTATAESLAELCGIDLLTTKPPH
ncbi:TIR domain-containing protein [Streptomyces sp. NPDC002851]